MVDSWSVSNNVSQGGGLLTVLVVLLAGGYGSTVLVDAVAVDG